MKTEPTSYERKARLWLYLNQGLRDLRLLGEGVEGVVLTDEVLVWKVFHRWDISRLGCSSPDSILTRVTDSGPWKTLYPVVVRYQDNGYPVYSYPFEESERYTGGQEEGFIRFLDEASDARFVMANVHPDNFRVTKHGIRLVDYGADIHPWSDEGFLHMARRAWLTIRYYRRDDLKVLMRTAIRDYSIPELTGFDDFLSRSRFRSGFPVTRLRPELGQSPGQEMTLDPRIVSMTLSYTPERVLDYGCGKGKVAEALSKAGLQVTAWDPNPRFIERCRGYQSDVVYLDSIELLLQAGEKYDVIVCSIVACSVVDSTVNSILTKLGQLVREDGKIVFSICHPWFSGGGCSELFCKDVPVGVNARMIYTLTSTSHSTLRPVTDYHRPWSWYLRRFTETGFRLLQLEETDGVSTDNGLPNPDFLISVLEPQLVPVPEVSLIIRACALEAESIDVQVRHIVRQLGTVSPIQQRIVAVDPRISEFPRTYGQPDYHKLITRLNVLLDEGVVDEIVVGPHVPEEIIPLNKAWFGLDSAAAYAMNGQAVATSIAAFSFTKHPYIVAVDADVMICRLGTHDPIRDAIDVLNADPTSVSVGLNIIHNEDREWTRYGESGPWRVEVRAAVFCRSRLFAARPFPNKEQENVLELPWHRALDERISELSLGSWRGGCKQSGFVHPPNRLKDESKSWLEVLDRVEDGFVSTTQTGHVDLVSIGPEWDAPKRKEPYVFVMCGYNVSPGRLRRCIDSLRIQDLQGWGAVVVDDASDDGSAEYLELLLEADRERFTFIRNRQRVGSLKNLYRAVHDFVESPETVILTLDLDDALLVRSTLSRVHREYLSGADMTSGSMWRTDKEKIYISDFSDPRAQRGGNVWQHLRTFKKRLFQAIRREDLMLNGEWIEVAADWAYMIPIVEMARNPVFIPEILYLYDPSANKKARERDASMRESIIERIVEKPRYFQDGRVENE